MEDYWIYWYIRIRHLWVPDFHADHFRMQSIINNTLYASQIKCQPLDMVTFYQYNCHHVPLKCILPVWNWFRFWSTSCSGSPRTTRAKRVCRDSWLNACRSDEEAYGWTQMNAIIRQRSRTVSHLNVPDSTMTGNFLYHFQSHRKTLNVPRELVNYSTGNDWRWKKIDHDSYKVL